MKITRSWLADLAIGILLTVVVLGMFHLRVPFLEALDLRVYDVLARSRQRARPVGELAIVSVDDDSIAKLGRWPWPRSFTAQLVDRLKAAGARVIGLDILFSEPERSEGLEAIKDLKGRLVQLTLLKKAKPGTFLQDISDAEARLDNDTKLAESIRNAGNVLLPLYFSVAPGPGEQIELPPSLASSTVRGVSGARFEGIEGEVPTLPLEAFADAAMGMGHINVQPDVDGVIRREPLATRFGGHYFPSLGLQVARAAQGLTPWDIKLDPSEGVTVGKATIPTDPGGRMLIGFYGPVGTFQYYPFAEVLAGKVADAAFKDKIVLVGHMATGIADLNVVPFGHNYPGIEIVATVVENVLHGGFVVKPRWAGKATLLAIIVIGLLIGLVLPRLKALVGAVVSIALLGAMVWAASSLFISRGTWMPMVYPVLFLVTGYIIMTAKQFLVAETEALAEKAEKQRIKGTFGQYVSPTVMEDILSHPDKVKLGGERKLLSVLFSDIRGFTTISEGLSPEVLVAQLNEYLSVMTGVVFKHEGTLDKFIGDAVMAFWGAPVPQEDHARRAVLCALEMLETLAPMQEKWRAEGKPIIEIGVGVNTGDVVVGNIGSDQRMDYTVIGDNVNLASRLEGLNKQFATRIIISEDTYQQVKKIVAAKPLGGVHVKGKEKEVQVYSVSGLAAGLTVEKLLSQPTSLTIGA